MSMTDDILIPLLLITSVVGIIVVLTYLLIPPPDMATVGELLRNGTVGYLI